MSEVHCCQAELKLLPNTNRMTNHLSNKIESLMIDAVSRNNLRPSFTLSASATPLSPGNGPPTASCRVRGRPNRSVQRKRVEHGACEDQLYDGKTRYIALVEGL